MAVLVEIVQGKQGVVWKDTDGVVWKSTADVTWKSTETTGTTLYLSLDGEALTHYWDAYIKSFSAPHYQTATKYGGYCALSFGSINMSPDAFYGLWLPPQKLTVNISYTSTTEAAAVLIFAGDIYLKSFDVESVTYNIMAPVYTQRLLNEGTDYDGNTVPFPRAFGTVTHVNPVRVADQDNPTGWPAETGCPTYRLSGIATTNTAKTIISFSSASAGTKTTVTTSAAHGYSTGNSVTIVSSINFNGTHTIESVAASSFVIPVAFPTDNSETLPITAICYTSGAFSVYDDGVPIQSNVGLNGDDTFSLNASPVGEITMCGTAAYTDLEDVVTWGQQRIGVGAIDTTYQRATSPAVNYWADSQQPTIDFLSDICAFFTHYFYIDPYSSTLHLGDMLLDAGTNTLDEYEYFDASYASHEPISQVKAEWVTRAAFQGAVNNDDTNLAKYVKDTKCVVIASTYTVDSGTADGTSANQLVDSGATFLSIGVEIGHVAQNTTDNTSSVVIAVSEGALELEDDIFVSGDTYVVGPSYPYGQEISVTPYHDSKSVVATALQNILAVLTKNTADIRIPISDSLPTPGTKITFTDSQMVVSTTTYIWARSLSYDFENEEVVISGEGVIS